MTTTISPALGARITRVVAGAEASIAPLCTVVRQHGHDPDAFVAVAFASCDPGVVGPWTDALRQAAVVTWALDPSDGLPVGYALVPRAAIDALLTRLGTPAEWRAGFAEAYRVPGRLALLLSCESVLHSFVLDPVAEAGGRPRLRLVN